jgi:hypothetical protein
MRAIETAGTVGAWASSAGKRFSRSAIKALQSDEAAAEP